jgi:hypothetical protein
MKNFIIVILFIIFTSCEKKKAKENVSFTNFVFSMSGSHRDYSMKFTESDTVYFEKRFPNPKEYFYSVISKTEKDSVNKIISEIDFKKYDSIYDEYPINRLVDGTGYKFYVENGLQKNSIYIYGHIGPKEFYNFAHFFKSLTERQQFHPTNKKIDFGNLNHILLPDPPPPPKLKTATNSG